MDRKLLLNARDEFRDLLAKKGTREDEFQRLFSQHPFLLSNSLPLSLAPADIIPQGRPGKAEVDFLVTLQPSKLMLLEVAEVFQFSHRLRERRRWW